MFMIHGPLNLNVINQSLTIHNLMRITIRIIADKQAIIVFHLLASPPNGPQYMS